ncbi:hypothetical protein BCR39DRAFT_336087 [Naematelia encephala]|uniref:Uncharacterized protein n=1 Tax=Naematelia encephala TaxID=71784 RepID=A0A1Y2ANR3_9TREE|nr:hypothetical protein BCR39DRAFT_336087 [Naematelia encephala]
MTRPPPIQQQYSTMTSSTSASTSLDPPPLVVPPINFSLVAPGIYRSGHPNKKNFGFLRRLGLKGIMYVEGTEEYRKDSLDFVRTQGLVLHRFDLSKESVRPIHTNRSSKNQRSTRRSLRHKKPSFTHT